MEQYETVARNLANGERGRAKERLGLDFLPEDGVQLWSTARVTWRDWFRLLFGRPLKITTVVWCERAPLAHKAEVAFHVPPVFERQPPVRQRAVEAR